jgi:hypothetical protein
LAAVQVTVGDRNDDDTLTGVLSAGADGVVDTIAYTSKHARQLLAHADDIGALRAAIVMTAAPDRIRRAPQTMGGSTSEVAKPSDALA